jgi:hypothetical protein
MPNTDPKNPDVTMSPTGASTEISMNNTMQDNVVTTRPTPDLNAGKWMASQRGPNITSGKMKK